METKYGTKIYPAPWGWGYSLEKTSDNGYIVTGVLQDNIATGTNNFLLVKFDEYGTIEWDEMYGINYWGCGLSVKEVSSGGYIAAGYYYINDEILYVVKTDSNGNITSTIEIPLPNSNRKLDKTIDILGKETKPST